MAGLRRVPPKIVAKLSKMNTPYITVGCGAAFSLEDLAAGRLASIGVGYDGTSVTAPETGLVPGDYAGRVSSENANGREVVHKDEPKIIREFYMGERPNYGDWSKGSFSLWASREVYRRSFVAPRAMRIRAQVVDTMDTAERASFSFTVEPVLSRSASSFDDELLFALSLLRENVGGFDVFESATDPGLRAQAQQVSWEIFPPGERDLRGELERRLVGGNPALRDRLLARAEVLDSLKPVRYVLGTGLSSNYYGALFADDFVVFENLDYGNATYVLYEEWESLSHLSRTELLQRGDGFDRLVHDGTWEKRLRELVKHERWKRRRR